MDPAQALDPRLLRAFVAIAEELHFTRAAARLFVAQQALSRDIRRLEDALGTALFDRSTRRVALTADGQRLLPFARRVLATHEALVAEMLGPARPLVVDVVDEGTLPARILDRVRAARSEHQVVARFGGGLGASLPLLVGGRLDLAFGRLADPATLDPSLTSRPVGCEAVALLVPADHAFAARSSDALSDLSGLEIDASVGNDAAPEWVAFAVGLLADAGAAPSPAHPHVVGPTETARHLREHGRAILTLAGRSAVAGAVVVPFADPAPTYPWSVIWRRGLRHPALVGVLAAIENDSPTDAPGPPSEVRP
jgi:DNA-binding transcriptional LysR family regulator